MPDTSKHKHQTDDRGSRHRNTEQAHIYCSRAAATNSGQEPQQCCTQPNCLAMLHTARLFSSKQQSAIWKDNGSQPHIMHSTQGSPGPYDEHIVARSYKREERTQRQAEQMGIETPERRCTSVTNKARTIMNTS